MEENNNHSKNINITGVNNRYQIKKLIKENKEIKKRVDSMNWNFSDEYFTHPSQLQVINEIKLNNYNFTDDVSKIALQQINKKLYGYKQQDILKKCFIEKSFVNIEEIIDSMIDCKLSCYYCKDNMSVLYDISREMKQWSIDRIDNDKGHNKDNYYLACLDCNLKRRKRSDDKFLFTKQLNILKQDT
uniref:HNH domain-containing protein n=1 Tax=viral metagenome TaxID=1070528 RepID=A0A6C0ESY9_9ZZZZ